MESTANGMSGVFYNQWKAAVEGTSGYIPFFSPWFDSDEYREVVPAHFERTFEEEDLVKLHGLDNAQLMFRRRKIAQNGREAFFQEYPSTADEAFISSGRPVFNPDQIHRMISEAKEPLYLMGRQPGMTSYEKHPRGELKVFHKRDPKETYYIGADVAMGQRNGDYSVAQVLDSKKRQVAVWRGHIHPDAFADELFWLGMRYYEAKIVVESNSHGILTAVRLGRDLAYSNTYTEVAEGQLEDVDSIKIGFSTNARTKPLIIDKLRGAMREAEIELNDKTTLREMLSYVVTESGKMTAEEGLNDDCVMSLALCNHIHEGSFIPIVVSDEFYTRAI